MSAKYPDLEYTTFPEQIDKQMEIRDPSDTDYPLIRVYNSKLASGDYVGAQQYLKEHSELLECMMNAEKILRIHQSIIALQRYFNSNIIDQIYHIGEYKGDWNPNMSSTAIGSQLLNMYDIVRYPVDNVKQYFMVISNNIVAGEIPTSVPNKYLTMTIKGDIGETGKDGIDGADGIGMNPKGIWQEEVNYSQYDLVSRLGKFYYALEDNYNFDPAGGSPNVWVPFDVSLQSSVGTDTPDYLDDGGIWLHTQENDGIIIKTKNSDGEFVAMYPETQASLVKDVTGGNMQDWIYRHYFERDDVKVTYKDEDPVFTFTASLVSNGNVVAKYVVTDETNISGKKYSSFTAYDETGRNAPLYKFNKIETVHDKYNIEIVPEVLV